MLVSSLDKGVGGALNPPRVASLPVLVRSTLRSDFVFVFCCCSCFSKGVVFSSSFLFWTKFKAKSVVVFKDIFLRDDDEDDDDDERSRGPLGGSFGASWEAFGGRLGVSWGPLGASWGLLGASRGLLGGFLGASGGFLGASQAEGSKCPCGSPMWAPFWSRLGGLFGCLGGLLGGIGALLRRLGALLEASWAILGRSWGPLGLSWSVGKLTRRECRNLSKT